MFVLRLVLFCLVIMFYHDASAMVGGHFRYLCKNNNDKYYFTFQPENKACTSIFLEESWSNLTFSEQLIVDYNSYDIVHEENKIKVWSRHYFSESKTSWDGASKYDHAKILNELHCGKRQVYTPSVIISLKGVFVNKTSFSLEDIEPETINDMLYKKVCKQPQQ